MLRSTPSQMWRWLSTNPGMTIMPAASMTSAPSASRPLPTATIRSRSISTSQPLTSPIWGSRLRTIPFLINVRSVGTTEKSTPSA